MNGSEIIEGGDTHIISLGAGVQSSTMALMATHGEITPMPDCAIFADTQAEPKAVYDWLDWLETKLAFPVHRVTAGNLWSANLLPRGSGKTGKTYFKYYIPTFTLSANGSKGMLMRRCTYDFKLVPIWKATRKIAKVGRGIKNPIVKMWVGISLDEAVRMKPAQKPWIENVFPLIDKKKTRSDCKAWMANHGYPEPPKSACVFCPYHNNAMWRDMKKNQPAEFARAVQFEKDLEIKKTAGTHLNSKEFLHSRRLPLDQIDFDTDEDRGQINLFDNECEGMCGL